MLPAHEGADVRLPAQLATRDGLQALIVCLVAKTRCVHCTRLVLDPLLLVCGQSGSFTRCERKRSSLVTMEAENTQKGRNQQSALVVQVCTAREGTSSLQKWPHRQTHRSNRPCDEFSTIGQVGLDVSERDARDIQCCAKLSSVERTGIAPEGLGGPANNNACVHCDLTLSPVARNEPAGDCQQSQYYGWCHDPHDFPAQWYGKLYGCARMALCGRICHRLRPLGFSSTALVAFSAPWRMAAHSFRGTNSGQDARFRDKGQLALRRIKLAAPAEYHVPIDMSKVNRSVVEKWVADSIREQMGGLEDEVLCNLVMALLDNKVRTNACELRCRKDSQLVFAWWGGPIVNRIGSRSSNPRCRMSMPASLHAAAKRSRASLPDS